MNFFEGKINILIWIVFVLIIAYAIILVKIHTQVDNVPVVAYIRSEYLISNFKGTLEAQVQFNNKKEMLQSNLDSLSGRYNLEVEHYSKIKKTLSALGMQDWEARLNKRQQQMKDYSEAVEEQLRMEDEAQIKAILNQLNSYINDYAKENGYDLILSNEQNSVFFGDEKLDITETLLKELNARYSGK